MTIDEYSHTIPDPLGLSSVDLLSLQAAHVTSMVHLTLISSKTLSLSFFALLNRFDDS